MRAREEGTLLLFFFPRKDDWGGEEKGGKGEAYGNSPLISLANGLCLLGGERGGDRPLPLLVTMSFTFCPRRGGCFLGLPLRHPWDVDKEACRQIEINQLTYIAIAYCRKLPFLVSNNPPSKKIYAIPSFYVNEHAAESQGASSFNSFLLLPPPVFARANVAGLLPAASPCLPPSHWSGGGGGGGAMA